jgi:hypothetical protein
MVLTTKDLEGKGEQEQTKPRLELADLEATELGQTILAEKQARQQAEQEEADAELLENLRQVEQQLQEAVAEYVPLRDDVLQRLEALAADCERLWELYTQLRHQARYLSKRGVFVEVPRPLYGPTQRAVAQQSTSIRAHIQRSI